MSWVERLFSIEGKVALVSGSSRGIGYAIADGLASAGAIVVGVGRSPGSLLPRPRQFDYKECDVTDRVAFDSICSETLTNHGPIAIYIHAAGVSLPSTDPGDALAIFHTTVSCNLEAAYACCVAVGGQMAQGGGGSIINVTSIGSVLGFANNPGYVAAKGGLRMMTKALAMDLGPNNIRVNNLAPGYIRTRMTEASFTDPSAHEDRLSRMIIKRWGVPKDLVGAAIFLASDASSYITGQDIFVDGGWTAKGL